VLASAHWQALQLGASVVVFWRLAAQDTPVLTKCNLHHPEIAMHLSDTNTFINRRVAVKDRNEVKKICAIFGETLVYEYITNADFDTRAELLGYKMTDLAPSHNSYNAL